MLPPDGRLERKVKQQVYERYRERARLRLYYTPWGEHLVNFERVG